MSCINCDHAKECHLPYDGQTSRFETKCYRIRADNTMCNCLNYAEAEPAGYSEEYVKYFNEHNNIYNKPKRS